MNQPPEDRVVLLTPEGRGAVASLRVEGPRAADLVARHFIGPKSPLVQGRTRVGHWGKSSPEEVVACRLGPEQFELHCHGGVAASARIIADLVAAGCRVLAWRDWIEMQEPDPIRAAARALLAEARTERTAGILLDQYNGALTQAIAEIIAAVRNLLKKGTGTSSQRENHANIGTSLGASPLFQQAAGADGTKSPEFGDVASAAARLDELLGRASVGLHLVEPWRVVLAGPPNAGKSSLINALVGYRRSIVHDRPGTTRDAVSVSTAFDGWPIELIDTAGLRTSDDPLEIAGIDRGRQQTASADVVLLVFDAAQPWTVELAEMARKFPVAVIVHNKTDLLGSKDASDLDAVLAGRPPGIATSALAGDGIKALIDRVVAHLIGTAPPAGAAIPFAASHVACLREAREHIDRREWSRAVRVLRPQRGFGP